MEITSKTCKCECKLYEFMRILCRNILVLFQTKNIVEIPSQYVMHRWTKEAARDVTSCQSYSTNSSDHSLSKALRSMHVIHEATKDACRVRSATFGIKYSNFDGCSSTTE
ncbi:hypothetical protein ACFE04_020301 [Oxalis oulophora]